MKMENKIWIIATLLLAMIFGTMLLPNTTSANKITNFTRLRQTNCVVKGDNDTPLRVRATPNGRAIGSVKVGSQIVAYEVVQDSGGNNWTKIKFKKRFGYVWTGFISCG